MSGPMQRVSALVSRDIANYLVNYQTWGGILANVRAYGAKGDGVTDDTAAFQLAIDTLAREYGGGILHVPPGKYVVAGTLHMNLIYTSSSNGDKGLLFEGSDPNTTEIVYTGTGVFFDGVGTSEQRKFVRFKGFRVLTDKYRDEVAYKPGTTAFELTWNQRYCHFDEVDIMGFDFGVRMRDNWIMEFSRVNTDRCNYGFYFEVACNAINIYGGEHKAANTAGIYIGDGEDVNLFGMTVETSKEVAGPGHGILIDSVKYFVCTGLYSEHLKGHVIYKRGTDPDTEVFRSITLIGGMHFNFNPPVADIKIEKYPEAAGNLVMLNANFQRVDLGTNGGGIADWAFDFGCTTTDVFNNLYLYDRPANYIRPYETALKNPLFDLATIRQRSGYDMLTLSMSAPPENVFNQRFIKFRREDAKNKFPDFVMWNLEGAPDAERSNNMRKLTITANGTDLVATSERIYEVAASTTYTLSGDATGSAPGVVMRLTFYNAARQNVGTRDFTGSTITFTSPATTEYAIASFIVPATVSSGEYSFEDMQLEVGSSATAFTPYHVDAAAILVTPEGEEFRILAGGNNINDWKPDGSGGSKLFALNSVTGRMTAYGHVYSPYFKLEPIDGSGMDQTNVFFVDANDGFKLKFRDQGGNVTTVVTPSSV